jgi:hypothetical protein
MPKEMISQPGQTDGGIGVLKMTLEVVEQWNN